MRFRCADADLSFQESGFQDVVPVKVEPDSDVEIQWYPGLRQLCVRLTDCRAWLQGRDFLCVGTGECRVIDLIIDHY